MKALKLAAIFKRQKLVEPDWWNFQVAVFFCIETAAAAS
jgi:hypothetical protein